MCEFLCDRRARESLVVRRTEDSRQLRPELRALSYWGRGGGASSDVSSNGRTTIRFVASSRTNSRRQTWHRYSRLGSGAVPVVAHGGLTRGTLPRHRAKIVDRTK